MMATVTKAKPAEPQKSSAALPPESARAVSTP